MDFDTLDERLRTVESEVAKVKVRVDRIPIVEKGLVELNVRIIKVLETISFCQGVTKGAQEQAIKNGRLAGAKWGAALGGGIGAAIAALAKAAQAAGWF